MSANISVIMTTHNGRKDVCRKAIQSVLDQTYQDWELIVIDDSSQDGTSEMVKEFNDLRIIYKHRDTNFGTDTKPKNEGILLSKGKYIAFLDSDNTYRPDHLIALLTELENEPTLSGVYGDRFIYRDGKPTGLGVTSQYDSAMILVRNYIDTSDVLLRREVLFDLGGFDERFKKYIDWNLWVRMSKDNRKFKRIPTILTDYNINSDSKSLRAEDTKNNMPAWNAVDCEVRLDYLGKKEPIKVAVFSLTHDRLEYTKECFDSLYDTACYPFDHFIVDNGSKDGTCEYLTKLDNPNGMVRLKLNAANMGISIASNQALDMIKDDDYDVIMKVDNDAFFKNQGWLAKMVEIHKAFPRFALSCYIEGLRDNPGGAPRIDYMVVKDELLGYTNHLGGICHFVDARAYDNFRWEEDSFLHGVQDMEFSQYLNKEGWFMAYMESWFVEHRDGTVGQHEKYPEYFKRREIEKATKYEKDR